MALVPDFRPMFVVPPARPPYSAFPLNCSLNSWMASTGRTVAASPLRARLFITGWPLKGDMPCRPSTRYSLLFSGRSPLVEAAPAPPLSLPRVRTTPGRISRRSVKFRPLRGRLLIVSLLSVPPKTALVRFTSGTINNLPLNGRNFTLLLEMRPGVVLTLGNASGGAGAASTNGLRPENSNEYLVEGLHGMSPFNGQPVMNSLALRGDAATVLPVDAIQEFNEQFNGKAE